jgi:uncharacterized membrane protein YphA (DoxX/SURF4 family)
MEVGLLFLRMAILVCFVLLFTLKGAAAGEAFVRGPKQVFLTMSLLFAAAVIVGYFTRVASVVCVLLWAFAACSGLLAGQAADALPYRDMQFVILFAAFALCGAGRFSMDNLVRHRR